MNDTVLEFISHHGVKGMKWGVRKARGSRVSKTSRTSFKKPPNKLSDAELSRRIKRMETEVRYNKLNAGDKSKGRQFVEGVLESSGRTVAKTLITGATVVAIKTALDRTGVDVAGQLSKRLG